MVQVSKVQASVVSILGALFLGSMMLSAALPLVPVA